MRDSLRAVLDLQSRKIGHPRIPSFFRTHIGADDLNKPVTLDDLYRETNDQFWKQTSYKIGQKLDPKNPEDAKMIPTWSSIFTQVKTLRINAETNSLFWKQTNYKVGQKLDPKIAADKAQIPIWISINNTVKTKYENLPRDPIVAPSMGAAIASVVPKPPSQLEVHATQAEVHQVQADAHKVDAAENAKAAIAAAAAGDKDKADTHTVLSNSSNEKAQVHQVQSDAHKDILKQLTDIHSLSGLAYLAAKSWSSTPGHSKFLGWAIKEDGTVETKWTDSQTEIDDWYGALSSRGFIWGLYWDTNKKDADGSYIPVQEYTPPITQAQADNALNNALGKTSSLKDAPLVSSREPSPSAGPKTAGGGGAIALMVVLGGGIAMAAASSKKR